MEIDPRELFRIIGMLYVEVLLVREMNSNLRLQNEELKKPSKPPEEEEAVITDEP